MVPEATRPRDLDLNRLASVGELGGKSLHSIQQIPCQRGPIRQDEVETERLPWPCPAASNRISITMNGQSRVRASFAASRNAI
jgi:hypothetical protein